MDAAEPLPFRPLSKPRPSFGANSCKHYAFCPYCWARQNVPAFRAQYGHLFHPVDYVARARVEGEVIHKTLEMVANATVGSEGTLPFPEFILHEAPVPLTLARDGFRQRQRAAILGMLRFVVANGITIQSAETAKGITVMLNDGTDRNRDRQRLRTRFDLVGAWRGGRTVILDYKSSADEVPRASLEMGFRLNVWAQARIARGNYGPDVDIVYLVPEYIEDGHQGRRWWCELSYLSEEMDAHGMRCLSEMSALYDSYSPLALLDQMGRACNNCPTRDALAGDTSRFATAS